MFKLAFIASLLANPAQAGSFYEEQFHDLNEIMEEVASGGASLAMFEVKDRFWISRDRFKKTCKLVSAQEVRNDYKDLAQDIKEGGFEEEREITPKQVRHASKGLIEVLGGGKKFYSCHDTEVVFMGLNHVWSIISQDGENRIRLITGHED